MPSTTSRPASANGSATASSSTGRSVTRAPTRSDATSRTSRPASPRPSSSTRRSPDSCRWSRRQARCPAPRSSITRTRRPICSRSPTPAPGIQGHRRCRPLCADRRCVPALHARAHGAADVERAISALGADAGRRAQSRAQRHPRGALALSHLLGQLERPARLRRAAQRHHRSPAPGARRPLFRSRPPIRATPTNGGFGKP